MLVKVVVKHHARVGELVCRIIYQCRSIAENPPNSDLLLVNKSGYKSNAENRLLSGQQRASEPRSPDRRASCRSRHEIYREKASGKSVKNRPELERAIDALGIGDILVVAEWDRATRSMFDGIEIIKRINDRGALIKVLDKPHLDLTTPLGRGFIAFLSAMAEDERGRILKRANDGRVAAKAKGTRFGRKPKLTVPQQAEALKRLEAGESRRAIARTMAVHHATVARLVGLGAAHRAGSWA